MFACVEWNLSSVCLAAHHFMTAVSALPFRFTPSLASAAQTADQVWVSLVCSSVLFAFAHAATESHVRFFIPFQLLINTCNIFCASPSHCC
jgi:hypothetical protein